MWTEVRHTNLAEGETKGKHSKGNVPYEKREKILIKWRKKMSKKKNSNIAATQWQTIEQKQYMLLCNPS